MTTCDKILLFSAALIWSPVIFTAIVLIGVALSIALALFVVSGLIAAPLCWKLDLAKLAGAANPEEKP